MACKKLTDVTTVIGYVRVSTDEQSLSADAQCDHIMAWCQARGFTLRAIQEDIGVSGGADLERVMHFEVLTPRNV